MPLVLPGYDEVVSALVPVLDGLPPRVVGIDGRDGVGKTTLGRYLAWHFNISLIETDLFLNRHQGRLDYRDDEIARLIRARLDLSRPVVVDGVCLLKLLGRLEIEPAFTVYVCARHEEDDDRTLAFDFPSYKRDFTPRAKADLVVTLDHEDWLPRP
ncbi:MAG TPA: hypothetical protein VK052_04945 [Zeimonas sp.]|nr:hypothetical protein [Zeimonas sp.]